MKQYDGTIQKYMKAALSQAKKAFAADEVPVGCVIVREGKIIAQGYNRREAKGDATATPKLCAYKGVQKAGQFPLKGCDMFVTLEPWPNVRRRRYKRAHSRMFFGAHDDKAGCCGTLYNLTADTRFNHKPRFSGVCLRRSARRFSKNFFAGKRKKVKGQQNI